MSVESKIRAYVAENFLFGDAGQLGVDESFLDLSELAIPDYDLWAREVHGRVLHDIGVPVSVGIAPRLKGLIFDSIQQIRKDGTAILIVEQDATSTLRITDRVYVLEHGRTIREGTAKDLAGDEYIRQVYLGV